MLVVVLDYADGSVHFHKLPSLKNLEKRYDDPVEEYLQDELGYSSDIHWMEVKC